MMMNIMAIMHDDANKCTDIVIVWWLFVYKYDDDDQTVKESDASYAGMRHVKRL